MQPCEAAVPSEPLVGAVDAGAVVDAHPAGDQRVARARRDVLAGEGTRPVRVRDVPGRIDLLGLEVVEPGRGVVAGLPDGDV